MIAALPLAVKIENIRIYLRVKWMLLLIIFLVNIFENLAGLASLSQSVVAYFGLFIAAVSAGLLELLIRKNKTSDFIAHISLCVDVLIIVSVLYFHGGVENSWLFLPIFVIFLSSYIFGFAAGLGYAAFSFIVVLVMSISQYLGVIPHFQLFSLPEIHWRNIQYLTDYMTGMFVLYFASAFAIGFLTRLAAQRAKRVNEYSERIEKLTSEEEDAKNKIAEAKRDLAARNAELEHLNVITAEQQLRVIELKEKLERMSGS